MFELLLIDKSKNVCIVHVYDKGKLWLWWFIDNSLHTCRHASNIALYFQSLVPRVAAKLDVSPVSDITGINDKDTFVRTIYAGTVYCYM